MKDSLAELTPLIQTLLWILFSIGLIIFLRKEIRLILDTITRRLEAGSEVEIGPVKIGKLEKQIQKVEQDVVSTNDRISEQFLLTMAGPMYENLKKLNTGSFGEYERNNGLERELYHLRDIGYINVKSIQAIPKAGDQLSKYVTITDIGRNFVEMREALKKQG